MDPNDRAKIRGNFRYLVGNLRVSDIGDYLYEKEVLNEDDFEELQLENRTERNKVRCLLKMLLKKGDTTYTIFCDSLTECGYEYVVTKLEGTDLSNVTYETPDEIDSFAQQTGNFVELQRVLWKQAEQLEQYKRHIDNLQAEHKELKTSKEDLKQKFEELEAQIVSKGPTKEYVLSVLEGYLAETLPDKLDGADPALKVAERLTTIGDSAEPPEQAENQTESDIAVIAIQLSQDIVCFLTTPQEKLPPVPNRYAATMRRTVTMLMEKQTGSFQEFIDKLSISDANGFDMLKGVADEMFSVGENNWGRVVALYAFAGFMAKHSMQNKMTSINSYIGDYIGKYVAKNLGDWIEQKGGWDDFEEFFSDKNETFGWKGLFITAIALGALASFVSVRGSQ